MDWDRILRFAVSFMDSTEGQIALFILAISGIFFLRGPSGRI